MARLHQEKGCGAPHLGSTRPRSLLVAAPAGKKRVSAQSKSSQRASPSLLLERCWWSPENATTARARVSVQLWKWKLTTPTLVLCGGNHVGQSYILPGWHLITTSRKCTGTWQRVRGPPGARYYKVLAARSRGFWALTRPSSHPPSLQGSWSLALLVAVGMCGASASRCSPSPRTPRRRRSLQLHMGRMA